MTSETPRPSIERATVLAEDLIERGAPWSPTTSWTIVLGQGIAAIVVGLIFLLKPLGGSSTTLQIVGLILLAGALINAFLLWRGKVIPERVVLSSFRAGSGITVGLVVVVATSFAAVTDTVAASLAVVVGVGFILFGLIGVATSFSGRGTVEPLPLAGLIANAVLVLAGVVLTLAGASGSATVDTVFSLLGILLIIAGLGLGGYSYLLRQQEASGLRR
ncbi:hypothetical protein BH24CHL9_BH24CHL9_03680 [soil metagenome]